MDTVNTLGWESVFLRFTIVRWPMLSAPGLMAAGMAGAMSNPWAALGGMPLPNLAPAMGMGSSMPGGGLGGAGMAGLGLGLGGMVGMAGAMGPAGLPGFEAASSFADQPPPQPFLLPPQTFMPPFMPHAASGVGRGW